ncbi:MAG: class IV adenylate cyclase [Alkalispirochaetaceae bacterium]
MSYEIEVKAWVADPATLEERLEERGTFVRHFEKNDVYFEGRATYGDQPITVRIREEGEKSVCTFKERRTLDGVEHNREWEFSIGDPFALETLLLRLGLPEFLRKRKTGVAYRLDDLLVELSEVEGLGHFVEVEILVDSSADEATQSRSKRRVREALASLGVPDSAIESKPYTQLLVERRRG